jgi:hypothetical protein
MCEKNEITIKICEWCGRPFPVDKKHPMAMCCSRPCYRKFYTKRAQGDISRENETVKSLIEKDDHEFEDRTFLVKVFKRMTGRACAV